jgi:hypothetical protein
VPPIKRRHLLQLAGSTLASVGLSQFNFLHQAERYGRVLAQGQPGRKLALLVGVNAYPQGISSLKGCLTDVELQWELLVHRYGFSPKDILVVSDRQLAVTDYEPLQPTRENILQAFEKHLIEQAKPGDVVVFHFSGHGSLVRDPNPLPELLANENGQLKRVPNTQQVNGTIVPSDRLTNNPEQVQDIMGRSLFLLMHALKTENVTLVLDSCHSGGGTRGNLLFRAVPSRFNRIEPANPSQAELEFQQRWMKDLKLSEQDLNKLRQRGIAKGVAIGSAQYDQLAADAPFDKGSFYAGAFTYLLTRYLWQQSVNESVGTVSVSLARSTRDTARRSHVTQEPIFAANPESNSQKPAYFLQPKAPFAEAVIRKVNTDGAIAYWLGGISSLSLETNAKGTIFSVIDASGQEVAQIEQEERQGLVGFGQFREGSKSAIKPGVLLRERVRGLPTNLKLKVGLDPSLGNEQEAVKAALRSVERLEVVASEQTMTYRLGRMMAEYQTVLRSPFSTELPKVGSVGLFAASLHPLTATFGKPGEGIIEAVNRLTPRFKSLLAAEILRVMGGVDVLSSAKTAGLSVAVVPTGTSGSKLAINQFQPGTEIQIKVKNNSRRDLFVAVVSIGSAGNLRVLYPYFDAPEDRARLSAGQELTLPEPGVIFPLSQTPGSLEIMVLASALPIRDALKVLRTIATRGGVSSSRGLSATPMSGEDAIEAMEALLGNLDRNTRIATVEPRGDVQAVDVTQFLVFSMPIEVVGAGSRKLGTSNK